MKKLAEDHFNSYEPNLNDETFGTPTPERQEPGVSSVPSPQYVSYVPYGYTPKAYLERKSIRKAALMIGVSLLAMLAVSFLWSYLYLFIAGLLGFSANQAMNFVSDPAVMQILNIVLSTLMFTVVFILVYKINHRRISDLVPLGAPKKGNRLAYYLLGLSFCAFANVITSYASQFFSSIGIDYNVDFGEDPKGFFGFLLTLASTVLIPGLVEEFACRGLILGLLRPFGEGFAVLTSAILFGLMHGNFEQMPFAFVLGLALGFIVVKTGSLWIAVAIHASNNLVSVVFGYLSSSVSQLVLNLTYTVYLIAALIIGLVALSALSGSEAFRFEKSKTESSMKQKTKYFFSAPAVIVFIVVCILESCMYFFI